MGKIKTKFAIAALLIATTHAVKLEDDCGGKWCNKGLAYDYGEPTLKKAAADNVAKTHHFNGSTLSDEHAKAAASAAGADPSAKGAANSALVLPSLLLLLNSPVPPTRIKLLSRPLRLPTAPLFMLRRLLSMHPSRLMMPRLRLILYPPEREETLLPPPLLRPDLMPT